MAAAKTSPKELFSAINPNTALIGGWILVILLLLGGYYFLFYSPLAEERAVEEGKRSQLADTLRTEEGNLRRYNTDVAELARARQHAQDLQNVLPNDADIPGFMRNINSLAEASGLQINLIQPVEERVEQYYARIPVQLNVRGSYLSLGRFFHAVSQLPRVINMENINLTMPRVDPTSNEVMLQTTVLATTFRSTVPAPGAARPAAAAPARGGN